MRETCALPLPHYDLTAGIREIVYSNATVIIFIRLHHHTRYVDVAYCDTQSSVVCQSVCVSVMIVSPAKTDEPIETLFGMWTWVGPQNHVLDESPDTRCKGAILRSGKGRPIVKYRDSLP